MSQADLADAAAALGIGVSYDTGYSGFVGSVPREATQTEHAASMIGQGKVTASALTMAIVMATVVRGSTLVPRLVDRPVVAGGSGTAAATVGTGDPTAATGVAAPTGAAGAGAPMGTASASATTPAPTAPPAPAKPLT